MMGGTAIWELISDGYTENRKEVTEVVRGFLYLTSNYRLPQRPLLHGVTPPTLKKIPPILKDQIKYLFSSFADCDKLIKAGIVPNRRNTYMLPS